MAIIRTPTGATITVPGNATVRDVIEKLRKQGFDNTVIYDPKERRPLAPDERVGDRDLIALDMSRVGQRGVEFEKSREYYAMTLREVIKEVTSIREVSNITSPITLPIRSNQLKGPLFIRAYCNACRSDTDHAIYADLGSIYIKCLRCGEKIFAGSTIIGFKKLECGVCKRITTWVIYCDVGSTYVKCIGCGNKSYVGGCP